jgi:hypothetical protein
LCSIDQDVHSNGVQGGGPISGMRESHACDPQSARAFLRALRVGDTLSFLDVSERWGRIRGRCGTRRRIESREAELPLAAATGAPDRNDGTSRRFVRTRAGVGLQPGCAACGVTNRICCGCEPGPACIAPKDDFVTRPKRRFP